MPKFTIYEAQDVSETRLYCYTVEAETFDDALQIVLDGDGDDPCELDLIGETDYGGSGYGFTPEEACDNLIENISDRKAILFAAETALFTIFCAACPTQTFEASRPAAMAAAIVEAISRLRTTGDRTP